MLPGRRGVVRTLTAAFGFCAMVAYARSASAQSASSEGPAKVVDDSVEGPSESSRDEPPIDTARGSGERSVPQPPESAEEGGGATEDPDESSAPRSHRTGRPPSRPEPTLPPGVARQPADDVARRMVAGGPTDDDRAAGTDDPELRALRDAERVLFAKPLAGVRPGWAWELPSSVGNRGPSVRASGLPPAGARGADSARETGAATGWLKRLRMPDLPVRLEPRVVKYLQFYKEDARGRRIARVWAKKSGRLVPALKAELARAGMPTDLVWLSLIESGHNPTIVSPAGAAGLWQFIPESARMYGLTVDRWVDERLDPEQATGAAIRYLKDLYARFGKWELAMAAYNMGHAGLLRSVRKYNTNDFWVLSRYEAAIPWETALYVPKIFAIAIVMNNRDVFGIDDIEPDPPISFDTVYVEKGTSLSEVARAAGVPEDQVRQLNAHFLTGKTPPDPDKARYRVRVPTGRGVAASQKLAKSTPSEDSIGHYVVRYGDTLSAIASDRGISERHLRRLNRIGARETLKAGTILLVPERGERAEISKDDEQPVVVVPARTFSYQTKKRVFYETIPGDSLESVARAFDVAISDLAAWNALDPSASLHSKMVLQIYVDAEADLSRTRHLTEDQGRVLVAGSDDFFGYFEGLKGRRRIVVIAEEGDTLSKIGHRYGMSGGMMERINHFSRRKKLAAGDRVVVYTRQPASSAEPEAHAPLGEVVAPHPEALPPRPRRPHMVSGQRHVAP